MDWIMDDDIEDINEPATGGRQERELVPEGRHTFRIVRASEDGPKFQLALCRQEFGEDDKRYAWVWCNAFRDKGPGKALVVSLLRALGISLKAFNASSPADLEGRVVDAEIYHRQTNRLWVNVRAFMEPTATAAQAPKKKAPPKAAVTEADDSIPF